MTHLKIRKGHNIRIQGEPEKTILSTAQPSSVALKPVEFSYVKPKLLVDIGDHVQIGTPLFFDKLNPEIKWGSPGAGAVKAIQYGERRVIEKIEIELDKAEESIPLQPNIGSGISNIDRQTIIDTLYKASFWSHFRQRPFNKVVNPKGSAPSRIFVSVMNTAPLSVDLNLVLQGETTGYFSSGLTILSKLTDGKVHVCYHEDFGLNLETVSEKIESHLVSGPHPAGNIGIQIHHIDPLKPGEIIWTISAQSVIMLGKMFQTGKIDPVIIVSVGGPSVMNPAHYRTRLGVNIGSLIDGLLDVNDQHRIVDGDVLTGRKSSVDDFLGFYNSTVSVLPIDRSKPFLGWIQPGSTAKTYSLTRSFFGSGSKRLFRFSTRQNGTLKALVPINAWEDVLPMDILPNPLYRSILAGDIEEMEKLGILECDEEDFALCSFACPSKIDLGSVIRKGLDLMEIES
ncbi:MAG: Na(+)-translocating NADH-quinone reductase subunit A [Candidatus Neomarinimicrobiota bacterium]